MEYGSIFGHGAYLGPDFTADYLRRWAVLVADHDRGSGSESAKADTVTTFKTNRYDPATGTLEFTVAQGEAFESLQKHYSDFFGTPNTKYGLRPNQVTDPAQIRQLTAYFCWSAWVASALRPGRDYSYTNNWPPEPLVGNHPTAATII